MTGAAQTQNFTAEKVIEVVRDLARAGDLPNHLIDGDIKESDTVETLGIDSLGGAFLVERFEDTSGVLLPDDFVELQFSIAEIASRLNRILQETK
ncbi:MAG: hypothetical protein AAF636_04865 [Pseudomonadota bacterium]